MKNIVMARIDDRLLHGQVVVSWIPFLKAEEIIIIDDESSNDEFMKELILTSAPEGIKTHVFTLEQSINYLKESSGSERVLILVNKISYIKELLDNQIQINIVNLGGLGHSNDRKRYLNFIHLSDDELSLLKDIEKMHNCNLEIQMIPNDKKYSITELYKN